MLRVFIGILVVLALGWAALFFSGKALLVWQDNPESTTNGGLMNSFTCTYFDGLALHTVDQFTSHIPLMGDIGSPQCERLIDMSGEI